MESSWRKCSPLLLLFITNHSKQGKLLLFHLNDSLKENNFIIQGNRQMILFLENVRQKVIMALRSKVLLNVIIYFLDLSILDYHVFPSRYAS